MEGERKAKSNGGQGTRLSESAVKLERERERAENTLTHSFMRASLLSLSSLVKSLVGNSGRGWLEGGREGGRREGGGREGGGEGGGGGGGEGRSKV